MTDYRGIRNPAPDLFNRLMEATEHRRPACADDPRFVEDNSDVRELAEVCGRCRLMELCHEYAAKAKPSGGVWAGRRWGGHSQVGRSRKAAA